MRVALLLTAIALAHGQEAGTVEGTATNSVTHAPIAGSRVTLTRAMPKEGWTERATTDNSGAYKFSGLRPGDYSIRFDAQDCVSANQNITVPMGTVRVNQELAPASTLSGRVLDDDGHPVKDLAIELYRFRSPGATRTEKTGSDGRFQFTRLLPGGYAIAARPASKPKDGTALAPTWYPDVTDRAHSERISVAAGADLGGYEIRLRRTPVWPLQGSVTDEEGKPVASASIRLRPLDDFGRDEDTTSSAADGTFRFPAVLPGEWQLVASQAESKQGFATVTVDKHDVERAAIRVYPPFSLDGFVERDEPRDESGKRLMSGVSLQPVGGQGKAELAFHEQDGSVHFKKVQPGNYVIFPLGFMPGYYLESVKMGDRDVFGKPVDLSDGSVPFRVVYKPNAGRVRGTVEKGWGRTVVLLPQDESMLNGQFIRTAKCDAQGRYEVGSLKPGEYYAFAFDRVDHDALTDVAFVRNLRLSAVAVHVEAGKSTDLEMKVTVWPE